MQLVVTPLSAFPVFTALIMLLLAVHLFENRRVRGATKFAYFMLAASLWAFATGLEMMTLSVPAKIFLSKISYFGIVSVAPLWFMFCQNFGKDFRKSSISYIVLLWILPIFNLILVFTNELHGLVWPSFTSVDGVQGTRLIYGHGPIVYLQAVYSYVLMFLGSVIFVRKAIQLGSLSKKIIAVVIVAMLVPLFSNALYLFFTEYLQGVEITTFSFALTGYILALSIFKYRFLKILPAAKERVYDSIQNGIIVLDNANAVVDYNPAVAKLIGFELTLGRRFDTTLSTEIPGAVIDSGALYVTETKKWVEVAKNELYDDTGHETGKIVLLYDVTHEREIQKELANSQKFFSTVADYLPDAIFIINTDEKVIVWNKAMEKLTGIPALEVLGKGMEVYSPFFYGEPRPMLANIVMQESMSHCTSGVCETTWVHSSGDQHTKTIRITGKNGESIYLWAVASMLFGQDGKPLYAIESIRDVTKNLGHEEELRKKLEEIERLNRVMINREQKMIELKKENEELRKSS